VTIMWTPAKHPHEDEFEDYAFARLSHDDATDFEEHLLVCERCQQILAQTDDYIRLMKVATAEQVAGRSRILPYAIRLLDHGLRRNIAAAAVLLLAFLTALLSFRAPAGDPQTISLEAYRAGGVSALARCPAGRPLNLKIDLTDAQPAMGYRVEVVDATGRRVWFGGTPARLAKGLAPGTYWVRLSTDTGEPLREFGLIAVR
jgi:hypothetical protein